MYKNYNSNNNINIFKEIKINVKVKHYQINKQNLKHQTSKRQIMRCNKLICWNIQFHIILGIKINKDKSKKKNKKLNRNKNNKNFKLLYCRHVMLKDNQMDQEMMIKFNKSYNKRNKKKEKYRILIKSFIRVTLYRQHRIIIAIATKR